MREMGSIGHMLGGQHADGGLMMDGVITSEEFTPATLVRIREVVGDRP
jgi:hypothetical protein